jgi:F-type H+-transporting ATPase subunit delta
MLKYIDFYREKNNIYSGKLITATAIDALTEKRLIAIIENQKKGTLEVKKEINEALLGGFILEVDNTRWDASMQSQLQKIKNELISKK